MRCLVRETHIQILQTVPAEGVLAAFTQHLCAALVPLDVDTTHRTLLDGHVRVVLREDPEYQEKGRGELSDVYLMGAYCQKPCRPPESTDSAVKSFGGSRVEGQHSL